MSSERLKFLTCIDHGFKDALNPRRRFSKYVKAPLICHLAHPRQPRVGSFSVKCFRVSLGSALHHVGTGTTKASFASIMLEHIFVRSSAGSGNTALHMAWHFSLFVSCLELV